MNIQHSNRTDRWFTPASIITLVKQVLGEIDLDPASEEQANEIIKAKRFFTKEDDGLAQQWIADTLFVNPPGSKIENKSKSALFWAKLVAEYEAGNVKEAIFMGFSVELLAISQKYGQKSILDYTFCVPSKRIKFVDPLDMTKAAPSHSNIIVYLGNNPQKFKDVFSQLGQCK